MLQELKGLAEVERFEIEKKEAKYNCRRVWSGYEFAKYPFQFCELAGRQGGTLVLEIRP